MSSHYLSAALHCPSSWPSQLSADLLSSSTHFTPTDARSYDSSDKIVPFSSILLKPSKRIPVDYLCFPWSRGRVRTDLLWDSGKVVAPPICLIDRCIQEVCAKKGFAKAQLTSENPVVRKARTREQISDAGNGVLTPYLTKLWIFGKFIHTEFRTTKPQYYSQGSQMFWAFLT